MASTTTYTQNGQQTTFTNSATGNSFTVDFSASKLANPPAPLIPGTRVRDERGDTPSTELRAEIKGDIMRLPILTENYNMAKTPL